MRGIFIVLCLCITLLNGIANQNIRKNKNLFLKDYSSVVEKIRKTIKENDDFKHSAFERAARFSDSFGPRLWGSEVLELAIEDLYAQMVQEDFENPRKLKIDNITHWVRGKEQLTLFSPRPSATNIPLIGLGKSVGGNVTASVIVVSDFDELEKRQAEIPGKIVCFNAKWVNYGTTVEYRVSGASRAAKYGAVAVLIRSISPDSIESPHTGAMNYDPSLPKIPAAAISLETADMFERMQNRGQKIVVNLFMEAHLEQPKTSNNLIGEILGTTYPEQIVLLGGHTDSWDVGPQTGANDDAGGVMVCFEVVRVLLKLGLRPKRTIRFVAWSGEEMGEPMSGGPEYLKQMKEELPNHILALENDLGNRRPIGFGYSGGGEGLNILKKIASNFLTPLNSSYIRDGDGTMSDTAPLQNIGIPVIRNLIDDEANDAMYYKYHHSAGDTVSIMNPDWMDDNVVATASLLYIIADMEERFPKD